MKTLVWYDPHTHEPKTLATIKMDGDEVVFEPKDAPKRHTMLKSLAAGGGKVVHPEDGQAYYDALDRLRGTYYEVKDGKNTKGSS